MAGAVLQADHCVHVAHRCYEVHRGPGVHFVHVFHGGDRGPGVHGAEPLLACFQDCRWDSNLGEVIRVGESVDSALGALAAIFFGSKRLFQQFLTKNNVF